MSRATHFCFDVLMQGSPFCDLTFSFNDLQSVPSLGQEIFADDFEINPGGIFNIAAALTGLDLRVGLRAELGDDIFSRYLGEELERHGIATSLITWVDQPLPIVTVGISLRHDRLFLSYAARERDERPVLTPEDFDRYRPRAFFTYGEGGPGLCDEARQRGILVFVDSYWNPTHLHSPFLRELLGHVDVFAPNLPEALEMTGTTTPEAALDVLAGWCDCAVIKCGPDGCVGRRGAECVRVPALAVEARDTTGAGDNFNAGVIYGMLQGYSLERSLRCGVIAGGLSTTVLGGSAGVASAATIETYLGKMEMCE